MNTAGSGLGGAAVTLTAGGTGSTVTEPNGTFRIGGLRAGTVTLRLSAPLYDTVQLRMFVHAPKTTAAVPLTASGSNVTLDWTAGLLILRGIVLDAAGAPVPATVVGIDGSSQTPVLTKPDGRFVLRNVTAGVQVVGASAVGLTGGVRVGLNQGDEEVTIVIDKAQPATRSDAAPKRQQVYICGSLLWTFSILLIVAAVTSRRRQLFWFTLLAPLGAIIPQTFTIGPVCALYLLMPIALVYLARAEFG